VSWHQAKTLQENSTHVFVQKKDSREQHVRICILCDGVLLLKRKQGTLLNYNCIWTSLRDVVLHMHGLQECIDLKRLAGE
jgi:hypothetical protein